MIFAVFHNTYTNQSTAKSKETSWTGASMAVSTINISTSAALGTLADAMLAAVEVRLQSSKTKRRNSSLKQAALFIALRGALQQRPTKHCEKLGEGEINGTHLSSETLVSISATR